MLPLISFPFLHKKKINKDKNTFHRGPNGVWTLEKEGLKPDVNISWDDARPTLTHMAIVSLEQRGEREREREGDWL